MKWWEINLYQWSFVLFLKEIEDLKEQNRDIMFSLEGQNLLAQRGAQAGASKLY